MADTVDFRRTIDRVNAAIRSTERRLARCGCVEVAYVDLMVACGAVLIWRVWGSAWRICYQADAYPIRPLADSPLSVRVRAHAALRPLTEAAVRAQRAVLVSEGLAGDSIAG